MDESTISRIAALARKVSTDQQVPIDAAVDWSREPAPPRWIARRNFIEGVSQLLHGERATLAICSTLSAQCEGPAQEFLAAQTIDEQRHVAIYERYLARVGDIAPVRPGFGAALGEIDVWNGHVAGKIAAVHALVEAAAVHLHADMNRWYSCPLLRAVHDRVSAEEARHVAFGRLWLKATLADLPPDLRADIARWLKRLWLLATGEDRRGAMGVIGRAAIAARWRRHARELRALGFVEAG